MLLLLNPTASVGGGSPPSLRQAYSTYAAAQAGVAVVAGDLIIVGTSNDSGSTTNSCSDNASGGTNTYSQVGTGYAGGNCVVNIFYAIAKASETLTITCTNPCYRS